MFKLILILFFSFAGINSAFSQMKADGKWYFPDTVRAMCINTEQGLVAQFKALVEKNREWVDPSNQIDKSNYFQLTEAIKKGIQEGENTWNKLGCVHILYSADKSNIGKR